MPRQKKKRRRRGGLSRLLRPLSVLLAAVAVVAALTMFFKVETIEVTGAGRYTAEEIIAASGVETGDNLILLDRYRIAQRIYTALPYITDVSPKQSFPSTLNIEVTETKTVAAIQGPGGWWLLNTGGKLLEAVDAGKAADYLQVTGLQALDPAVSAPLALPEDSPITAQRLLELLSALDEQGVLNRADSVDCSDPATLILNYDGRFRVELLYDADFPFKIAGLRQIAEEALEPNETGTLRMTYENNDVHLIPNTQ